VVPTKAKEREAAHGSTSHPAPALGRPAAPSRGGQAEAGRITGQTGRSPAVWWRGWKDDGSSTGTRPAWIRPTGRCRLGGGAVGPGAVGPGAFVPYLCSPASGPTQSSPTDISRRTNTRRFSSVRGRSSRCMTSEREAARTMWRAEGQPN
jgi:hypothetical protein